MSAFRNIAGGVVVAWLVVIVLAIIGWAKNLIFLIGLDQIVWDSPEHILRVVGVFLGPLGSFMGWFA